MTFVSYAQNFEDVILWRALGHISKGFYVDVGAHHPTTESVTKAFYEAGWSGINIEPARSWYQLLAAERARDINLCIAVGQAACEQAFFEIPNPGLSTLSPELAKRHALEQGYPTERTTTDVVSLTDILDEHAQQDIHFLKIDVEGAEKDVLAGMDFEKYRPWILVVEATEPNTQVDCSDQWQHLIPDSLYSHVYFDGLNRFYLSKEHPELAQAFNAPPNFWDGFIQHEFVRALDAAGHLRDRVAQLEQQLSHANHAPESEETQQAVLAMQQMAAEQAAKLEALQKQLNLANSVRKQQGRYIEVAEDQLKTTLTELNELKRQKAHRAANDNGQQARIDQLLHQQSKLERRLLMSQHAQQNLLLRAQGAERLIGEKQEKIDQLHTNSHVWYLRATELDHQTNAIVQSLSWRITAPVRAVGALSIRFSTASRQRLNAGLAQLIQRSQAPLSAAMRLVIKRPAIANIINAAIRRFPHLQMQLIEIALRNGVLAPVDTGTEGLAGNNVEDCYGIPGLSAQIRRNFEQLGAGTTAEGENS